MRGAGYRAETVRKYRTRLDCLLGDQLLIENANDIDFVKIMKQLSTIKYKNYFSQAKNALLHFCEFQGIQLNKEYLQKISILESKTKKKYRKSNIIDYQQISKTIKNLKNDKLKLSYNTMMCTGLRVTEISQITPIDCKIEDDKIVFYFIGKGGENEEVSISKNVDIKFFNTLVKHIKSTDDNKKVFYSAIYLQQNAKKLNFHCHDLRRIFAQLEYQKTKDKKQVQEKLRHTNIKTTNIYLRYKIKF